MEKGFTAKLRKTGNSGSVIVTVPASVVTKHNLEVGEYYDFNVQVNQE